MTNPVDIIAAFDKAIVAVWGEHMARMWPHPKDKMLADKWIAAGASVALCERVFMDILPKRKERSQSIPTCLSYFDNPMRDAIAMDQAPVEDDPETSRWKARVQAWVKNPKLWLADKWGEPPGQPGCRAPKRVIQKLADT